MRLGDSRRTTKNLTGLVVGVVMLVSGSLWAQSQRSTGRTNTNTAHAVLHIQVNVVPTVFAGKQEANINEPRKSITYLIPTVTLQQEVTTHDTIMSPAELQNQCVGDSCRAMLRTTTVVPR